MAQKETTYQPTSSDQGVFPEENVKLRQALQRHELFTQLTKQLLSFTDIQKSIPDTLKALRGLFECRSVSLYQNGFDQENSLSARKIYESNATVEQKYYTTLRYADFGTHLIQLMEGIVFKVTVSDIRNDTFRKFWQQQGVVNVLLVPIIIEQDCWGYIQLIDRQLSRNWEDDDIEMLRVIAGLIRGGLMRSGTKDMSVERKERYQSLVIQEVHEAIISMDLDHRIISWNKGAEEIYEVKEAQMVGKTFYEVFHHQYIGIDRPLVFQLLEKEGSFAGEFFYTKADGKKKYLECTISYITDQQHQRIGIAAIHHDITDKKAAAEALQKSEVRYRSVIDALREGVIILNAAGKVVSANESALKIMDTDMATLLAADPNIYHTQTFREDGTLYPIDEHPGVSTLRTGISSDHVIMGVQRHDKSIVWISINAQPVYYTEQRKDPDAVVLSFDDVTEMRNNAKAMQVQSNRLAEHAQSMQSVLDSITDAFFALDPSMHVILWNKVFVQKTNIQASDAIGKPIDQLLPEIASALMPCFMETLQQNTVLIEEYFHAKDEIWYEVRAYPSAQGLFISFHDITQRKLEETLIALEKEVLSLNATSGASLKHTLEHYLSGLESLFTGIYCSVIKYHEVNNLMEVIAGPRLPDTYIASVNGMQVGPQAGSCGTAIFLKEPILISDINTSPFWSNYLPLADSMQFKSSWAYPLLSSDNKVLGTFVVFQTHQGLPTAEQVQMIQRAVQLLKPIMEQKLYEEKIKTSNERYLLATMATNDAIWDVDLRSKLIYWAEGFKALFGYRAGTFRESERAWENAVHPQDLDRVEKSIYAFIDSKSHDTWREEYRFKRADGRYVLVVDRGFLIFDTQGAVARMVGAMQDITEKRELENKLIREEVNRHKFVTQAVVDAQEKERSEIGKELHDNVNQILSTAKLYLEVARNKPPDLEKILNMSAQYISVAINEIRAISKSLVPSSIGDLGLIESIKDLIEGVRLTKSLNIEFNFDNNIERILVQQQKLMLFRIIQEQLNNVLRHAHAANFTIDMIYEDGQLQLVMTDDGVGFDPEDIKLKRGVGLFNINSRVELFNGKADIFSSPGAGCTIMIQFPI